MDCSGGERAEGGKGGGGKGRGWGGGRNVMVYVVCEAGGKEGSVFGGDADEAAIESGASGRSDRSRGNMDEVVEDGL